MEKVVTLISSMERASLVHKPGETRDYMDSRYQEFKVGNKFGTVEVKFLIFRSKMPEVVTFCARRG